MLKRPFVVLGLIFAIAGLACSWASQVGIGTDAHGGPRFQGYATVLIACALLLLAAELFRLGMRFSSAVIAMMVLAGAAFFLNR